MRVGNFSYLIGGNGAAVLADVQPYGIYCTSVNGEMHGTLLCAWRIFNKKSEKKGFFMDFC